MSKINRRISIQWAKRGVLISVIIILILTILEFPSPIGFETRPQGDVSMFWLVYFLLILVTEIATIPLIFKLPKLGVKFAIVASVLNILQIFADQLHLMQPEVAPLAYSLLEYSVGVVALALIYFARNVNR